jgi:hypothetical protein
LETRCERRGHVEIGVIDHTGHVFAAFRSSVNGRYLTAYTRKQHGRITLTRWDGTSLFGCRTNTVQEHHDGSIALMIRLKDNRFIVGYALGDDGMLFRGELLTDCDEDDARREALSIAEHWMQIDAEDEADPWHGEPGEPGDGDYPHC